LVGHERYLKNPEYACLIISANQGVLPLTKEPLGFLLNKRTINYFCQVP